MIVLKGVGDVIIMPKMVGMFMKTTELIRIGQGINSWLSVEIAVLMTV